MNQWYTLVGNSVNGGNGSKKKIDPDQSWSVFSCLSDLNKDSIQSFFFATRLLQRLDRWLHMYNVEEERKKRTVLEAPIDRR